MEAFGKIPVFGSQLMLPALNNLTRTKVKYKFPTNHVKTKWIEHSIYKTFCARGQTG